MLEDVSVDKHAARVFQLEEILDCPGAPSPALRLEDVVAANLDVRRNQIGDLRIGSAEQNVFSRPFQVVVGDLERPGAVPSGNGLRIGPRLMNLRDVGVDDGGCTAVERETATHGGIRATVYIDAIEDQGVRKLVGRTVAELDEPVAVRGAARQGDFNSNKAEVMRSCVRLDGRPGTRRNDFR